MSEPVEYQYRTRPDWITEWNGWNICSKESAEAYEKTPYLHDWHYEVRRLYITPPQRKPLTDRQVERLYRNIETSRQQDARSFEAFKRLLRVIEAAHGIAGEKPNAA
jgi:hypothetical protein